MLFRSITLGLSNFSLLVGGVGVVLTGSSLATKKPPALSATEKETDPIDQYVNLAFKASLICLGFGLVLRIPSLFSQNPRNLLSSSTSGFFLEGAESFV